MADEAQTCAALIAALSGSDKVKIRAAVDELIVLGSSSDAVKTLLEEHLASAAPHRRWTLAYVLGELSQPSATVLRALEEGLDLEDSEVRWAVALLLTKLARSDAQIGARLRNLCASGTATQRRMALYCVRELRLADEKTLETVFQALKDPVPLVRVAAVITLKAASRVDNNGKAALYDLFLNDLDARVRNVAAITLATLGNPSEQFLTALREAAASADPQIKKAAVAALSLLSEK
jgi:hypothetical protein